MQTPNPLVFALLALLGAALAPIANAHPANDQNNGEPPTPGIHYRLLMPNPQTHYLELEMQLTHVAGPTNAAKTGYLDLKMPVWTPGSYLIREYAKNVEGFSAALLPTTGPAQALRTQKLKKNVWRVYTNADGSVFVKYRVYANELSVRTSFVDADHAYITPASVFLYHDALKTLPLTLTIIPANGWKAVTTAMVNEQLTMNNEKGEKSNDQSRMTNDPMTFTAPNFDILVDSPIEVGNQHSFSFVASGVPHRVAMFGIAEGQYDQARLKADYQRVCEAAASVVGEVPIKDYTFIVHHIPTGGGGLEHLNSTTLQTYRNPYTSESNYRGFLTLVAHEYFHLWNVKRIRPIALGPFDYEAENYTTMLWWAEGVTSFYEDNILRRAGLLTPEQYLGVLANDINGIENQPGNRVQSVAESSLDAWIKYYRPNENSGNSTVSYYSKGSVLGNLLNLSILASTNGQRSLDDLMRKLYQDFYKAQNRGFTDAEFQAATSAVAGRDMAEFFRRNVESAEPVDYNPYFAPVGLRLVNTAGSPMLADGFFGASVGNGPGGRATVTSVRRGSAAENAGVNVGDQVMEIDDARTSAESFLQQIGGRKVGAVVNLLINRAGLPRRLAVTLIENPLMSYKLEPVPNPTPAQRALYNRWLFVNE